MAWNSFATPLIGKAVRAASRLAHGGGSAFPGKIVERIDPQFLSRTLAQLPLGVVLVSGTNGKTTTTRMVASMLQSLGLKVFTNPTGSNFTRGVVSSLLAEVSLSGKLDADIAVLELDEAYAVHFVTAIPAMVRMMDTSCAMVSRTPGRCTLMATSSPVSSFARCTCARLAEPSGVGSIWSKISSTGRPYSSSSTCSTVLYGMGSASARSLDSSSQNDCGRISERMDRICPTLTNVGPSASSMRRILTGVSP